MKKLKKSSTPKFKVGDMVKDTNNPENKYCRINKIDKKTYYYTVCNANCHLFESFHPIEYFEPGMRKLTKLELALL